MAESEDIKMIINYVAIQAATAVMMAFRGVDVGPQPTHTAHKREPQIQRYNRPVLVKPSFNSNVGQVCKVNEL